MTTDRHDPDPAPELSDEFWGEQTEWTQRRRPAERSSIGATIGRWWDHLLGGDADSERAHGRSATPSSTDVRRHDSDLHDDGDDGDDGDNSGWTIEPEPSPERRGGVDPLIARLGGLAVIVTLAAPLIVGFTASGDESSSDDAPIVAIADAPEGASAAPATTGAVADASVAAPTDPATSAEPLSDAAEVTSPPTSGADQAVATSIEPTPALLELAPDPAPVESEPVATTPPCGARYELAAGDYWIRLADAAGVSLSDLLAVNDASVDTVLVPGRSICLPVGAATPAPPTTAAPAPSRAVTSNTSAPRSAVTTSVAPAPATTVPSRPAAVPASQAVQIIRDVWPDDLEERAIQIAWRESNHKSNVNNSCCYGLFQIHWTAHKSWLASLGVTSAVQLYDPTVNATAAYALYQRSGGFGPWGG